MKKILLIIAFVIAGLGLQAQKTMEIGLIGGGMYYIGDLNPATPFLLTKPAYGAVARLNLNPRWAVKLSGIYGSIMVHMITGVHRGNQRFLSEMIVE